MGVFKTYDIRGVYGVDIDTELSYRIGRAFARFIKARSSNEKSISFSQRPASFLAGHDARLHSREMYQSLIEGLTDEGAIVCGLGLTSTPALHYLQMARKHSAGVMTTASHNPPEYHGFKLFDGAGGSVSYRNGLDRIEREVAKLAEERSGDFPEAASRGNRCSKDPGISEYSDFLCTAAGNETFDLKLVIDGSHGSSGAVFSELIERLSLKAVLINGEPDGSFPNHGPNPLDDRSRTYAGGKVREESADLGVLLDGDGDRIIFLDETGRAMESSFTAVLIAEQLLRDHPGSSIVYDLISSRVLPEEIERMGGRPVMSRVGYTYLHEEMIHSKAVFGSEASGHAYFRVSDEYYTESAAYALIMLLKTLRGRTEPLSRLVSPLRDRYAQAPETNLEVEDKEGALKLIEERYSGGKISKLDGISIQFTDFWFNVRPSNTEPVLRIRLEARTKETAMKRMEELVSMVKNR